MSDKMIPLAIPSLGEQEYRYVKECLDTNWVSSVGPFVSRFEKDFAQHLGVERAVAVVNGTAALHTALMVAGVRPDDEVFVSDLTFVAPANAVRYIGAHPVFIDADPVTWQMDVGKVRDFLEKECRKSNKGTIDQKTGRRVRAVIPVHILGHPVDLEPLLALAKEFDLILIEDASESLGARYKGAPVGTLGDVGTFSFNGNKIITTGGGGMFITRHREWADRAKYLTTQAKDDPVEYRHDAIGYNYRLPNILAALGLAQMESLNYFIEKKRAIARRYTEAFVDMDGVTPPPEAPWAFSIFWLYTILVDEAKTGISSRALMRALEREKIVSRPLWMPMHLLQPFAAERVYRIEHADHLWRDALSIPCSSALTEEDQDRVIKSIKEILNHA